MVITIPHSPVAIILLSLESILLGIGTLSTVNKSQSLFCKQEQLVTSDV